MPIVGELITKGLKGLHKRWENVMKKNSRPHISPTLDKQPLTVLDNR